jgi:hypothetical protein
LYIIDKQAELTESYIAETIQKFELNEKPRLNKYLKYYKGNQEIMNKIATDVGKPCNRIVSNYCFNIV